MSHLNRLARQPLVGLALVLFVLRLVAAPPSPAVAPETSVHPGINDEYLKPGLVVTQWVERFESEGREIYAQRARIVTAAQLKPGARVADIGAGTGLFTLRFAQAVGPRGKVYAVDIVKDFLAYINERATAAGLTNIQTVLGTDRSIVLPPNSVDTAFVCDVYHHFEYPQSSLASIHRALRPGGQLVVVDFKRIPGQTSAWVLNHVRASQEQVTAEIQAAGFQLIDAPDFLRQNYLLRFRKVGR